MSSQCERCGHPTPRVDRVQCVVCPYVLCGPCWLRCVEDGQLDGCEPSHRHAVVTHSHAVVRR